MSGTDYQNHASRMQAAATAAHKDWVTTLTREQRENLKRLKVLDPDEDSSEVGGHSPLQSADMADSSLAHYGHKIQRLLSFEEWQSRVAKTPE